MAQMIFDMALNEMAKASGLSAATILSAIAADPSGATAQRLGEYIRIGVAATAAPHEGDETMLNVTKSEAETAIAALNRIADADGDLIADDVDAVCAGLSVNMRRVIAADPDGGLCAADVWPHPIPLADVTDAIYRAVA